MAGKAAMTGLSPTAQSGYCQCGCGQKTPLTNRARCERGYGKGQPQKFVTGHHIRPPRKSYKMVKKPDHPRATTNGYVLEHILIAEKALGKSLPPKAAVHHFNEDKTNNDDLVICQNHDYHFLLHQRKKALEACGHANWLKCPYCKKYDAPAKLYVRSNKSVGYHRSCESEYQQNRRKEKSGEIVVPDHDYQEGIRHFDREFEKRERLRGVDR